MFGILGEENIRLVLATADSKIRFVLTRHEQAAAFMADVYGRITGKAGVCTATLGPGAINLALGGADAQTDSTPLVAITAQVGLNRIYRESHQIVDVVSMYKPAHQVGRHSADSNRGARNGPQGIRRRAIGAPRRRVSGDPGGYRRAPGFRPGQAASRTALACRRRPGAVQAAARLIRSAKRPIILAGHGAARACAAKALTRFSGVTGMPVATTFMGKGARTMQRC